MTSDPRAFFTLDLGAATTAAALVCNVQGSWRLLGSLALPATIDREAILQLLLRRVREAAPAEIVAETELPEAAADVGRLVARTTPPPTIAVIAATDARRVSLGTVADRAGWRVRGGSLDRGDRLDLLRTALDPAVEAVLVGAADPPLTDERARLEDLQALADAITERRPNLPVVLAGSVAGSITGSTMGSAGPAIPGPAVPGALVGVPALEAEKPEGGERLFAPAPNTGDPPGSALTAFLLGMRARSDDARQGVARSTSSLAAVTDRHVETLEIGFEAGLRAAAWPAPDEPGGVAILSAESVAAALFPAEADEQTVDAVLAWSTLPIDRTRLRDRLRELRLWPWADAQGDGALLRLASARVAVARLMTVTPAVSAHAAADLVIAAGGVWSAAPGSAVALALADVRRRPGACQMAVDHARLLGPLGTIEDEGERRQLLDDLRDDLLLPIGSVVLAQGVRPGRTGGRVAVRSNGDSTERDLVPGTLEIVDVPPGQLAQAEFEFREPVLVGTRGKRFAIEVSGGLAGLLVDLRDIPLRLPDRAERRRDVLADWQRPLWPGIEP